MRIDLLNKQIGEALKFRAKSLGITQADIAKELDVSIGTIKRWYSGKGFTVSSIQQLSEYLGISLSQLFAEIENEKETFEYTLKQEKILAQKPELLVFFDHLLRGKSIKQIQNLFNIKNQKTDQILLALDKVGLIELHENNKVKLLRKGEPVWKKDGPLSKKFKGIVIDDFLCKLKEKDASFFIHDYLVDDLGQILLKMEELKTYLSYANKRASKSNQKKASFGTYFALKEFSWNLDSFLD